LYSLFKFLERQFTYAMRYFVPNFSIFFCFCFEANTWNAEQTQ